MTTAAHPWKPSDGFIAAGPDDTDTDDEGGIDLDLDEIAFDIDLAAALHAWEPDDWFGVLAPPDSYVPMPVERPRRTWRDADARTHTFVFDHATLCAAVRPELLDDVMAQAGLLPGSGW